MSIGTPDPSDGFSPAAEDDFGDGLREDLRARVKSELEPGERLLWAARSSPPPQPMGVGFFVWCVIALLLFAFGAAAFVHGVNRPQRHEDGDLTVMAMTLGLAGGIIVVCALGNRIARRFERVREANVCYAVTDLRAISWIPEAWSDAIRVRSLSRGQIKDVVRVERPDGSGTLEFSLTTRDMAYPWHKEEFKHVPDVRRVEQIVRHNLTTPEKSS